MVSPYVLDIIDVERPEHMSPGSVYSDKRRGFGLLINFARGSAIHLLISDQTTKAYETLSIVSSTHQVRNTQVFPDRRIDADEATKSFKALRIGLRYRLAPVISALSASTRS